MRARLYARSIQIAVALVLLSTPAIAREPEGIKLFKRNGREYIEWGESKREIQARLGPFLLCTGDPVETCIVPSDTWQPDFGQKRWSRYFRTSLDFLTDEEGTPQFFRYRIELNADLFEWVRDAFAGALGSPSASETSAVQNRIGATFDQVNTS